MSDLSGRGLVAPLARKRKHLERKGATRKHKAIAGRLPAGSAELESVPKGKDFVTSNQAKVSRHTRFEFLLSPPTQFVSDQNRSDKLHHVSVFHFTSRSSCQLCCTHEPEA